MKQILIIFSIFLFSFRLPQNDDTAMLYQMAIKNHLSALPKENNGSAATTIYLINEDVVELPDKIDGHPIQLLGDEPLKYLGSASSLHASKVHPIKISSGKIVIQLSDFSVTKGTEGANISFGGCREYFFSYNGKTKSYRVVQTKTISF